ncbi:MAG: Rod shape-determining protein RodA [Microgenomates group bacterium Gr01-1014_93]|nr:MAG: Rod shape-determining protein RodA [Microgenomates group bacterium Gr01-1014_93]
MIFKGINLNLTIPIIFLLSIGILVIYSSSSSLALNQFIFAILGFLSYILFSLFDYKALKDFSKIGFIGIVLLLLILAILGTQIRGVIRWIPLWFFNIQPAEIAKPIIALCLANFWINNKPSWANVLKSLGIAGIPAFLIFIQPALGSALTILGSWIAVLLCTKISFRKILILILIVLIILPLGWLVMKDYQKQRVLSFISPGTDPLGHGYNLIQSTIAVGSGQVFGRGLGFGTQSRLEFLPERRTDFIFASIAEEFGFLGSLGLLGLYFFLMSYCFKVANNSPDYFGFILTVGITSMLLFQIAVNIGMNVGLLPITGITLPLVSYGGSSLFATMVSLGLVASVANRSSKY